MEKKKKALYSKDFGVIHEDKLYSSAGYPGCNACTLGFKFDKCPIGYFRNKKSEGYSVTMNYCPGSLREFNR